jgi:GAF domain-containing protein
MGGTRGVLGVVSLREDAFAPKAANLLEEISGQIAIAVENALNFESARIAEREAMQERDSCLYRSTSTTSLTPSGFRAVQTRL